MCSASLSKVFDFFDIDEELDVNTVNGWVCLCLDKLPEKGDTFTYASGGRMLEGRVTKATGKKALEINIVAKDAPKEDEN